MNDKRQLLLFKAMKNGGTISTKTANRIYSGNGGKDALISLEMQGYLENLGFGNFKVIGAPDDVIQRYRAWKNSDDDEDGSDWSIKQRS